MLPARGCGGRRSRRSIPHGSPAAPGRPEANGIRAGYRHRNRGGPFLEPWIRREKPEPDPHPPRFAPGERGDAPLLPGAATAEGWWAKRSIDDTEASLAVHLLRRTRNQNDGMLASKRWYSPRKSEEGGSAPCRSPLSHQSLSPRCYLAATADGAVASIEPNASAIGTW